MSDLYLVTGGAGFIGSNIAEKLVANGEKVRVIDNFLTGKQENMNTFIDKIQFIKGLLLSLRWEMNISTHRTGDLTHRYHLFGF